MKPVKSVSDNVAYHVRYTDGSSYIDHSPALRNLSMARTQAKRYLDLHPTHIARIIVSNERASIIIETWKMNSDNPENESDFFSSLQPEQVYWYSQYIPRDKWTIVCVDHENETVKIECWSNYRTLPRVVINELHAKGWLQPWTLND
jgi:hypothetical protein